MGPEFLGKAFPLSDTDLANVCEQLGTKAAHIWAVLHVETIGCGFLPDRRPKILFERHQFSEATQQRFDSQHPISAIQSKAATVPMAGISMTD